MLRIVRTFALLAFVAICAIGSSTPAQASFGNCRDPAYLALFDERLRTRTDFDCISSEPVSVTSEAGTSQIRIIQHLTADWALAPGAMRAIKNGVAQSAAAMARLGRFRMSDVTIALVDDFGPDVTAEVNGEIAAWTNFEPGDECRITLWLLGPGARDDYAAAVVSHELFHCVQRSSLTTAQIQTGNLGTAGGGTWWIEGSADWFTTLAMPAPAYMQSRVDLFDSEAPTTSINGMAYEDFVFFSWLGQTHGANSVMPFLQAMAPSTGVGAQRAAMAAALPADDWLQFAESYADQSIRDGQGAPINSHPTEGALHEFTATRTQRIDLAPFTITRRKLAFRCGRWTIAPRPDAHSAAKPTAGAWGDLPGDLDNLGGGHADFEYVAFNATADVVPYQLAVTLAARCTDCGGVSTHDACMIGTWQVTTDGVLAWMREHIHNYRVTSLSAEGNTLTLNSDGTFTTGASNVSAEGRGGRTTGEGELASQATGRWSTSGGQLNMCYDAATAAGSVTIHRDGHSITVPVSPTMPALSTNAYSCAGETFTHTIPIGTHGAVNNLYTRMSH